MINETAIGQWGNEAIINMPINLFDYSFNHQWMYIIFGLLLFAVTEFLYIKLSSMPVLKKNADDSYWTSLGYKILCTLGGIMGSVAILAGIWVIILVLFLVFLLMGWIITLLDKILFWIITVGPLIFVYTYINHRIRLKYQNIINWKKGDKLIVVKPGSTTLKKGDIVTFKRYETKEEEVKRENHGSDHPSIYIKHPKLKQQDFRLYRFQLLSEYQKSKKMPQNSSGKAGEAF